MGISAYWCQIFIIPKGVIICINPICRAFLWFGVADSSRPRLVEWKEVRQPKKVGSLGIRDLFLRNQMAVGKIAWHFFMMKDLLWVRWVHGIKSKVAFGSSLMPWSRLLGL